MIILGTTDRMLGNKMRFYLRKPVTIANGIPLVGDKTNYVDASGVLVAPSDQQCKALPVSKSLGTCTDMASLVEDCCSIRDCLLLYQVLN